jgi:hypothetical protein
MQRKFHQQITKNTKRTHASYSFFNMQRFSQQRSTIIITVASSSSSTLQDKVVKTKQRARNVQVMLAM